MHALKYTVLLCSEGGLDGAKICSSYLNSRWLVIWVCASQKEQFEAVMANLGYEPCNSDGVNPDRWLSTSLAEIF